MSAILSSDASTATKGGSVETVPSLPAAEIRNGLELRCAVGRALLLCADDDKVQKVWYELRPEDRDDLMEEAAAACMVIAQRVVLPRIERCLKNANTGNESAMVLAICHESVLQTLTGMNAAEAHDWVLKHGTLNRTEA